MTDVARHRSAESVEDRLREEHQTIEEVTARIERAGGLDELLQRLEEFRALLVPHFLAEEAPGGFFDVIRERAPRLLAEVVRLQADHQALLREMERLAVEVRRCLEGPVAEVLAQARFLARRQRQHETVENRLLLDAMYLDDGPGD